MEKEEVFNKIQVQFRNSAMTLDLTDTFSMPNKNEIEITGKGYRNLYTNRLTISEFDRLIVNIKLAILKSEQIAMNFFNNESEMNPLYFKGLEYYDVDVDLISYGLNLKDNHLPIFEFDILIDCMDKNNQPIFMYDSRGTCTISFELNYLNELRVVEIS